MGRTIEEATPRAPVLDDDEIPIHREGTVEGKWAASDLRDYIAGDPAAHSFTNGDATPSVLRKRQCTMANADITDFDDGVEGQIIYVTGSSSNKKLVHDATKIQLGGCDLTLTPWSTAILIHRSGVWTLLGFTANRDLPKFTLEQFGAKGDGVTDDTPALVAMLTAVQAAGGGECHGRGQGANYAMTSATDGTIATLTGLKGFKFLGHGSRITWGRDFSSSQYNYLILFSSSSDVEIAGWEFYSEIQPLGEYVARGMHWLAAGDETVGVHVHHCKVVGGVQLLSLQPSSKTLAIESRAKNIIQNDIEFEDCAYGIGAGEAGNNLHAWNIRTLRAVRSVIVYGIDGFDIEVYSRDPQSNDILLKMYTDDTTLAGYLKNGRIRYTNNQSHSGAISSVNAIACVRERLAGSSTPGAMKNVRIELDVAHEDAGAFGLGLFSIFKHTSADASVDAADVADEFDLSVSGRVHLADVGANTEQFSVAHQATGWGAGSCRVRFENLTITGDTNTDIYINETALRGGSLVMDRVDTVGTITRAGAATGQVSLRNVTDKNTAYSRYDEWSRADGAGGVRVKNRTGATVLSFDGGLANGNFNNYIHFNAAGVFQGGISVAGNGAVMRFIIGAGSVNYLDLLPGTSTNPDAALTRDDNGAIGAVLQLYQNSASPAPNDFPGILYFAGKNDAGTKLNYGAVALAILDPASGSEDSQFHFQTRVAGTLGNRLMVAQGVYTPNSGGDKGPDTLNLLSLWFNNANRLYSSAADELALESVDAGAGIGPIFCLDRFSASPAASDALGSLMFRGRDSAGNVTTYGQFTSSIIDATDGSEDSRLQMAVQIGGALTTILRLGGNGGGIWTPNAADNGLNTISAHQFVLTDGVTLPSAASGFARLFIDSADGDLKIIFGDGTVKTIVVDT